jgi:serine protein kinase
MSNRTEETERHGDFVKSLVAFTQQHRAAHWSGTFAQFVEQILPPNPRAITRTSHQYIWDMIRWQGLEESANGKSRFKLFADDLFGIDEELERLADYFRAASAGSEVGRRLLLLLGPPAGGKSSIVILLKRGLEEYSHTDEGAIYGIQGCPIHESPLHLVPYTLRPKFRETYGVEITGELCPLCRDRLEEGTRKELAAGLNANGLVGDFMKMPVERIFVSEAGRLGIGTYAPHDPVYAASRGMLEMIEILKVKREFLYLLLTLTQEKNVKVSRFPLIHLDETILAHTNLAEFRKFLQESENEALLDRMVIIQVPYTLNFRDEARIYQKLISNAPAFAETHLDPHVLHTAAVFAILTRLHEGENESDASKKVRVHAGEEAEGISRAEAERIRARLPDEALTGISPRFVINSLSNAIVQSSAKSLTTMDVLLGLKDAIESDARIDPKKKRKWVDFLVIARKDFYNKWVKEDVHKALFVSFEQEAQDLLDKYLDEVEATLDNRLIKDPMTGEERKPDERFLRSVEEKIDVSDSGKQSFRQEIVRKAMGAFKRGDKFTLNSHALLHDAIGQYLFEQRRDVLRLVSSATRPDEEAKQKISVVEKRLVEEYGYDAHSAREALNYVTTLLAQE